MDAGTLEDILWHIHNWFDSDSTSFTVTGCDIVNGELPAVLSQRMLEGQWYRIEGSWLNDGLHQYPSDDLSDETFDGTVTLMRIPKPLLRVAEDIEAWKAKNSEAAESPYSSESFGGYSYTLKGGIAPNSGSQGLSGWRLAFRDQLNPWRKM